MNFLRRYKYWIIVTIIFVVVITFFVKDSILDSVKVKWRINETEQKIEFYKNRAKADSIFLENLKDDDFLEKFARENFYMKYEDEEIYIVPEKINEDKEK